VQLPFEAGPFCQLALRHGVELIPGSAFSADGRFADHLRLPFTVDPSVMEEAIRRLRRVVDGYSARTRPEPVVPPAAAVV
jgi:aspartate/methionine/tyrosine aminotransferase